MEHAKYSDMISNAFQIFINITRAIVLSSSWELSRHSSNHKKYVVIVFKVGHSRAIVQTLSVRARSIVLLVFIRNTLYSYVTGQVATVLIFANLFAEEDCSNTDASQKV